MRPIVAADEEEAGPGGHARSGGRRQRSRQSVEVGSLQTAVRMMEVALVGARRLAALREEPATAAPQQSRLLRPEQRQDPRLRGFVRGEAPAFLRLVQPQARERAERGGGVGRTTAAQHRERAVHFGEAGVGARLGERSRELLAASVRRDFPDGVEVLVRIRAPGDDERLAVGTGAEGGVGVGGRQFADLAPGPAPFRTASAQEDVPMEDLGPAFPRRLAREIRPARGEDRFAAVGVEDHRRHHAGAPLRVRDVGQLQRPQGRGPEQEADVESAQQVHGRRGVRLS